MYQLTNVYGDLDFWTLAKTRMALGVGLPLIFIPILAASYEGIPANRVDMASALINAARANVTVGEMMGTMEKVFGRHVEVPTL